jgi:hypothetical protein
MTQFDYFIFCQRESCWPVRPEQETLPADLIGDEL